jgi:hypothetical protein
VRTEAESFDEIREIDIDLVGGKRQADVVLDCAPRQQTRLLKNHSETPGAGGTKLSLEISIQPGSDPQNRGLAATGGTDQRAARSGLEAKFQVPNDIDPRAIG